MNGFFAVREHKHAPARAQAQAKTQVQAQARTLTLAHPPVNRLRAGVLCACLLAALGSVASLSPARADDAATAAETPIITDVAATVEGSPAPISDAVETPEPPEPPADPAPAPRVVASRSAIEALNAGQQATFDVTFQNLSDVELVTPVATFAPSAGLQIVGGATSFVLPNIAPQGTQTIALTVEALPGCAASAQSIAVETGYSYVGGAGVEQGFSSDALPIITAEPAVDTPADEPQDNPVDDGGADWSGGYSDIVQTVSADGSGTAKPVPNIIVNAFSYGEGATSVIAGSDLTLWFVFQNTSASLAAENIVATLDTGDAFTINGGTNTLYFTSLGANATQAGNINLKAVATDKAVSGTLSLTFKYEYVESNERKNATSEVKLTVPVALRDRFELGSVTPPTDAAVGMESTVVLSYVNKGKGTVNNVATSVSGDGIEPGTVRNVGNIESGKSGSLGFMFTPTTSGTLNLTLNIDYEDANEQVQHKTIPVSVTVADDMGALYGDLGDMGDFDDTGAQADETATDLPVWAIAALTAAGVGVVAAVVVVVRRRGRKHRATAAIGGAGYGYNSGGYPNAPAPLPLAPAPLGAHGSAAGTETTPIPAAAPAAKRAPGAPEPPAPRAGGAHSTVAPRG